MQTSLDAVMNDQDGVISRRQVLAAGFDDAFIRRRVRRKDWARIHDGVYVAHTGLPSWDQRAWAGVMYYWPAALAGESALKAHGLRRIGAPLREQGFSEHLPHVDTPPAIHVAVEHTRRVARQPGLRVSRVENLGLRIHPSREPARLRLEEAVLMTASEAPDDAAAIAVVADACQTRRTTPGRLAAVLQGMLRLRRRGLLLMVLEDVASGAYSVLEHRYLTRVERPHGLPTTVRQRVVRHGRSVAYRDVEYIGFATVVELDGRLGHELSADRWGDLDRDIEATLDGDVTLRLGWLHTESPTARCRTASAVARLLHARGWTDALRRCGPGCTADMGDVQSPDD